MNSKKSSGPKTSVWAKRVLWALLVLAALYGVLGTFVWNILFGLAIGLLYPNRTIAEDAANPTCKVGDWVIEKFNPLVSDKRMIENWLTHKADMTLAAEMSVSRANVGPEGVTQEARALYGKINVESVGGGSDWSLDPYSIEYARAQSLCLKNLSSPNSQSQDESQRRACLSRVMSVRLVIPSFGRTHAQFFCTTRRNTFKQYLYFPGPVSPRIVDGYLQGPLLANGEATWKKKLVPSTDHFDGKECTVRALDDRWFISLC